MNIFTTTATATTTNTNNNNNNKNSIKNNIFFPFSDGERKTYSADHETSPDRITDI
jgi:hypothetical protein